jgi:hypothetical protein
MNKNLIKLSFAVAISTALFSVSQARNTEPDKLPPGVVCPTGDTKGCIEVNCTIFWKGEPVKTVEE